MKRKSSTFRSKIIDDDEDSSRSNPPSTPPPTTSSKSQLPNVTNNVYDNCCFVIFCQVHKKIMLTNDTLKFFPSVPLKSNDTWLNLSTKEAMFLLFGTNNKISLALDLQKTDIPFQKFMLLHIFRYQLPQTQKFITRLIYLVILEPRPSCCKNTNYFIWAPIQDAISSKISNVRGPEVSFFSSLVKTQTSKPVSSYLVEFGLKDAFKFVPRNPTRARVDENATDNDSAGCLPVKMSDIENLYADFIEHCFPSFFMTRESFQMFMVKHEIEMNPKVIYRYFQAFQYRNKHYIQFHELLNGLYLIDPRTPHADTRFDLVFR